MAKTQSTEGVSVEERISGKLLDHSIHFLNGDIDENTVGNAIKWIVYENLDQKHPKTLTLYINSSGGDLYQAFALIDIMKSSHHPIRTVGHGQIMSAAFLIFTCGTPGQRYIAPNTGIMCHQYSDSAEGKHHDLIAQMAEGNRCNARMLDILKRTTGLPASKIKSRLLRESDVYITAEEAVELKIADHLM